MSEQVNLPVPVQESHVGMPAQWTTNPFQGIAPMYISWDISTNEGKLLAMKCSRKADFTTDDVLGQEFVVKDVLCHAVELISQETGELTQAIRTVLVDTAGQTFGFVSKGVFDSLQWMGALWGPPPWPDGKKIKLVQSTTKRGRRILQLEPIME